MNATIRYIRETAPFDAVQEFSSEHRYSAFDLRNPNGGQSSGPLEIERPWDAYTDDQLCLMDHLGINKFVAVGLLHWRPLHLEPIAAGARARRRCCTGTVQRLSP